MHHEAFIYSPHGIAMYQLSGNYAFNHCTMTSEGTEIIVG